jgi:hypothetical protein
VKVRAQNLIEWGDFSEVNSDGAIIFVEPYQMSAANRGYDTSEVAVQVEWQAIEENSLETGGSQIDSYNLQWKVLYSTDDFTDIIG